MAPVRSRGRGAILRAPATRGWRDQVQPQEDHRRRHRLAVPPRAEEGGEGVTRRTPFSPPARSAGTQRATPTPRSTTTTPDTRGRWTSAKRKVIAKEFQEFMTDKLYWNTISGSPFNEVAQPWMKDYVYQSEWKVLYNKVWLDK